MNDLNKMNKMNKMELSVKSGVLKSYQQQFEASMNLYDENNCNARAFMHDVYSLMIRNEITFRHLNGSINGLRSETSIYRQHLKKCINDVYKDLRGYLSKMETGCQGDASMYDQLKVYSEKYADVLSPAVENLETCLHWEMELNGMPHSRIQAAFETSCFLLELSLLFYDNVVRNSPHPRSRFENMHVPRLDQLHLHCKKLRSELMARNKGTLGRPPTRQAADQVVTLLADHQIMSIVLHFH